MSATAAHLAVRQGDLQQLQAALAQHPEQAAADDAHGWAPLHDAAQLGSLACLRALLAAGADVDAANSRGATALFLAAGKGHEGCVRELLAAGASTGAAEATGMTPLHITAGMGHLGCLRTLLAAGAEVEAADGEGYTPLLLAAQRGQAPCLRALLAAGADLTATERSLGFQPLHLAAASGNVACLRQLIDSRADLEAGDSAGRSALCWAAAKGQLAAIRCLVAAGAAPAGPGGWGASPREVALREQQPAAAQLLQELERQQGGGKRQPGAPLPRLLGCFFLLFSGW